MAQASRLTNRINVLIDNAKSSFFRNTLINNKNNPKKFWRIIQSFTDNNLDANVNPEFKDSPTGHTIPQDDVANYLNQYFV